MPRRDVDDAIAAVAAEQEGKFCRRQVLDVGGDDDLIERRLASGRWLDEAVGTYGFPGMRTTFVGRVWVAHLAVGPASKVTHETAAQLRDVEGFIRGRIVLSVPHGSHPRLPGVRLVQSTDLHLRDFTPVRGLPVETVPWIFVDMAAVSGRRTARLTVALNTADVSGQTSYEEVGDCLRQVARRGKPGARTLTAVLDARRPGRIPRATQVEHELDELIERFNLPKPQAQFPFPGRQFVTGCVDRAYPDAQLILEADSRRWHTRIQDVKRDHERDHEAGRNGWDTLRIYREHMLGDPQGTAAVIAETYAVRLAQVQAVRANSRQ